MPFIKLNQEDRLRAKAVGVKRQQWARSARLQDAHGLNEGERGALSRHIEGALGELAVAKAFGIEWDERLGLDHSLGDVGAYEVRATKYQNGRLIIRECDPDDRWFILVRGGSAEFEVVGAMLGRDAKQARYLKNPQGRGAAYFVPASDLQPIESVMEVDR